MKGKCKTEVIGLHVFLWSILIVWQNDNVIVVVYVCKKMLLCFSVVKKMMRPLFKIAKSYSFFQLVVGYHIAQVD